MTSTARADYCTSTTYLPTQDCPVPAPQKFAFSFQAEGNKHCSKAGGDAAGPGEKAAPEPTRLKGSTIFTLVFELWQTLSLQTIKLVAIQSEKLTLLTFLLTEVPANLNPQVFLRLRLGSREGCRLKEKTPADSSGFRFH